MNCFRHPAVPAVGICKAVMFSIAPQARIIDITHQVTPFDIAQAGRFLAGSAPYFPHDAVFVAVIDPTVGSTRKAIIAKSKVGQYFVLPDNGMITQLADRDGLAVPHRVLGEGGWDRLFAALAPGGVFVDVKSMVARDRVPQGTHYWSL